MEVVLKIFRKIIIFEGEINHRPGVFQRKINFSHCFRLTGQVVAQLVDALRQETGGRGFDFCWCRWNFSSDLILSSSLSSPGVHSVCNRNKYQRFLSG